MPESFSDWLGIAGFVLALGLAGWHIWRERKENREQIALCLTSSVGIDSPHGRLEIHLANRGKIPVFIKRVELGYEVDGKPERTEHATVTEVGGSVPFILSVGMPNPLAPGDRCTFVSNEVLVEFSKHLSSLGWNNLSINAYSGKGLVACMRDSRLHQEMIWMAQRHAEPDKWADHDTSVFQEASDTFGKAEEMAQR